MIPAPVAVSCKPNEKQQNNRLVCAAVIDCSHSPSSHPFGDSCPYDDKRHNTELTIFSTSKTTPSRSSSHVPVLKMPASPAVFHALLRPAIIQVLRATGFHSAKPAVIDSLTDLAARYLEILCNQTSHNAADRALNEAYLGEAEPGIVDVRVALQEIGAFMPERDWEEQDFAEVEDTRGVEDFVAWAKGPRTEQMKRVALDGSEEGVADYLSGMLSLKVHFCVAWLTLWRR